MNRLVVLAAVAALAAPCVIPGEPQRPTANHPPPTYTVVEPPPSITKLPPATSTSTTTTPPTSAIATAWVKYSVTAYCLTGYMASGPRTFHGAAASWHHPFGTKLRVVELDLVVTVLDRTGRRADGSPTTDLDLAWPGECDRAIRFGRQTLTVEVLDG